MKIYRNQIIKYIIAILFISYVFFTSCTDNTLTNESEIESEEGTKIKFINLEDFTVTIYKDSLRTDKLVDIAANETKIINSEPNLLGIAFYPTFYFDVFDIPGINIPYNGIDIIAAIEPDKTTTIYIHKLENIDIDHAYIKIINNSNYSFSFKKNNIEIKPLGSDISIIIPDKSAVFDVIPGMASGYSIMRNTITSVPFPGNLVNFERGLIYILTLTDTGLSLTEINSVLQTIRPSPPENIDLLVLSNNCVQISWSSVYGATTYKVYRATDSNPNSFTQVAVINNLSYTNTELLPGNIYYYKISALSSANYEGILSNAVSIIMSPANVRITTSSTVSITLRWNPFTGVNKFNIYRADNENGTFSLINTVSNSITEITDTDVLLETRYYYRISAVNGDDEGLLSNEVFGETLSTIPVNLRVTSSSSISVNLAWNILNGVTGYNVYRSVNNSGTYIKINNNIITTNSFIDTNLSPSTVYYYRISSINNNIESSFTVPINTSTLSAVPDNIIKESTLESISLSWNNVSEASEYNIYRSNSKNDGFSKINNTAVTKNTYTDTLLSSYTSYFYKISAIVSGIEREQSVVVVANTGIIVSGATLNEQLNWLQDNVENNNIYKINIKADENITPRTLSYTGKSGISLIISGDNIMRNINLTSQGSLFTIGGGVLLTLESNITLNGITSNNSPVIINNGSLYLQDNVKIINNTSNGSTSYGGGVYNGGTLIMNGGEISGNSSTYGGGVYNGSTLIINDGEISMNTATYGGGIYNTGNNFIINSVKIHNNSASSGGGLYLQGTTGSSFVVFNDGEISNNSSSNNGGGISIGSGTFTMNGGKIFSNKVAEGTTILGGSGGGVYITSGSFIMKGGEISGNTALGSAILSGGGGIYAMFYDKPIVRMSGGVIYGNNAATELKNSTEGSGASLYYSDFNGSALQYGTFNGDNFTRRGNLNITNDTIRIINGVLYTY